MDTQVAQFAIPYIALLPLIGALLAYLGGLKHRDTAGVLATLASALSFLLVFYTFWHLPAGGTFETRLFTWFSAGPLQIDFTLRFDELTAVMCLVITGVGTLIHYYSTEYMAEDESRHRYFAYLNLFLFAMLTLVLGGNLLVMFIGWEGVGLCSYLLIGFWFKNKNYAAAGNKAFIANRIGDFGFLLGIFLLYWSFSTADFVALKAAVAAHPNLTTIFTLSTLALFVGATGKSAQIPLFVWLPDAMAGPTPVSALIHAATMVTAGVYMMARLNFLFILSPEVLTVVAGIAILTAFIAGTTAIAQNDIKKVLAYSTVSQLGFMFLAAACGAFWVAIFHLVTHAFFKACLFLGAGSVIRGCHHEQDMRKMGGLLWSMPITGITYLISVLAISGIFPFAGFQSKHAILAAIQSAGGGANAYLGSVASSLFILASLTAGITAFYMTRSFALTFLGRYRGVHKPHESPVGMIFPLVVLALFATFGGLYLEAELPHYLSAVLPDAVHVSNGHTHWLYDAFEYAKESLISSWVGLTGILVALIFYARGAPQERSFATLVVRPVKPLARLFAGQYFVDELYELIILRPVARISRFLWKGIDEGVVASTVDGVAAVVEFGGETLRGTQTGQLRHYALFMFGAVVVLLVLYLSVV